MGTGGMFGEWESMQGRRVASGILSFQPCEGEVEQSNQNFKNPFHIWLNSFFFLPPEKALNNLSDGLKRETKLLLQKLGHSKEVSERATGITTDFLDALLAANGMEPNANALTEETILKIKKNNEIPEDAVTPDNVIRLMEIGFSDTDSIRTLKVYVNADITPNHFPIRFSHLFHDIIFL